MELKERHHRIQRGLIRYILACVCLTSSTLGVHAQCDSTIISGDMIHISDGMLSGTYIVDGTFHVMPGVTIYVQIGRAHV